MRGLHGKTIGEISFPLQVSERTGEARGVQLRLTFILSCTVIARWSVFRNVDSH